MTSKIVKMLEMLGDGQWHRAEEIKRKMDLDADEFRQLVLFLKEYNFVVLEDTGKAVKIDESAREFLSHAASP